VKDPLHTCVRPFRPNRRCRFKSGEQHGRDHLPPLSGYCTTEFHKRSSFNCGDAEKDHAAFAVRELLIGSHILPWRSHAAERLNVRKGICLSRLHDAAFDQGLISFDDRLRLLLLPTLKHELAQRAVADNFAAYEGQPLALPEGGAFPDLSFLAIYRAGVFRKT